MQLTAYNLLFKEVDHFKNGAYVFSSQKGEIDSPVHQHNKGQLIYAEHGTLYVDMGQLQYFLPVKHFIWIPPNTEHRVWSNNTHISMLTIYFDLADDKDVFYKKTGVYVLNPLIFELLQYAKKLEGHINKANDLGYKFALFLRALLPEASQSVKTPLMAFVEPHDARVSELLQYMRHHLSEKLGMEEMAFRFGFSARSLSRLFNAQDGSYTEYLQSLRIVKSMELMSEKNLNVNMVASQVGYESYSAFSKVFLKYTGMKPLAYIKKSHGR
jgi:AraC-like DNA-binding protein/quercetin dioxygenase-like cupin family protein